MQIKILKRMMIGRTIVQKDELVAVTAKEGKELLEKGYVIEVDKPDDSAAKTKPKAKVDTDDKAD